jgi:hypothetical protein
MVPSRKGNAMPLKPVDFEAIILSPDEDCPLCGALLSEKSGEVKSHDGRMIDVIVCIFCNVVFNLKWHDEEKYK